MLAAIISPVASVNLYSSWTQIVHVQKTPDTEGIIIFIFMGFVMFTQFSVH